MANYFDRILYLYPNITGMMYWVTQSPNYNARGVFDQASDGKAWPNPYDGIIWENTDIPQPSQKDLDALDDATVNTELARRAEVARKAQRDIDASTNLALLALFQLAQKGNPQLTMSQYLDQLETLETASLPPPVQGQVNAAKVG